MSTLECCTIYKDHVFVFESHTGARHGKGAGTPLNETRGGVRQRIRWCAIPTRDSRLRPRPLHAIADSVNRFIGHVRTLSDTPFYVTRIGCGLAGYTDEQIAPMFRGAPDNCVLPDGWRKL